MIKNNKILVINLILFYKFIISKIFKVQFYLYNIFNNIKLNLFIKENL